MPEQNIGPPKRRFCAQSVRSSCRSVLAKLAVALNSTEAL